MDETKESARELVDMIFDRRGITATVGAPSACSFDEHFRRDFAALIERYAAAQVAKAREEVDAMLWTTERVMGADAADAMRRWLDDYRATGRLVVRDAGGAEIEHFPEARA